MSNSKNLLTRITKEAQILGIKDKESTADLLREARSEILRLQTVNQDLHEKNRKMKSILEIEVEIDLSNL